MQNQKFFGWSEGVLGILLILLGGYSFAQPITVLNGTTVLYGLLALLAGLIDILLFLRLKPYAEPASVLSLISGLLSIASGFLILIHPSWGTWASLTLIPLWFMVHCLSNLARLPILVSYIPRPALFVIFLLNIIGILLGCFIMANPLYAIVSISYLIGLYVLMLGINSLIAAYHLLHSFR